MSHFISYHRIIDIKHQINEIRSFSSWKKTCKNNVLRAKNILIFFIHIFFLDWNIIEKGDIETVIEYFRQETVHIETTWSIRHPYAVGSTLFNSQVQCRCNPSAFEIFFLSKDIYFPSSLNINIEFFSLLWKSTFYYKP